MRVRLLRHKKISQEWLYYRGVGLDQAKRAVAVFTMPGYAGHIYVKMRYQHTP